MNKSEIYRLAQVSVLKDVALSAAEKIEMLKELFEMEEIRLYTEREAAKNGKV